MFKNLSLYNIYIFFFFFKIYKKNGCSTICDRDQPRLKEQIMQRSSDEPHLSLLLVMKKHYRITEVSGQKLHFKQSRMFVLLTGVKFNHARIIGVPECKKKKKKHQALNNLTKIKDKCKHILVCENYNIRSFINNFISLGMPNRVCFVNFLQFFLTNKKKLQEKKMVSLCQSSDN